VAERHRDGRRYVCLSPLLTTANSLLTRSSQGIVLVAAAGLFYHYWCALLSLSRVVHTDRHASFAHRYKWEVLRKMERAFSKGYDPVLELAQAAARESDGSVKRGRVRRKEQTYLDKVINGEISGEYLLLMGPKGVGKTSMLLDAMIANEADGCAMLEAHEDPEVVRLRLGKALDFEYNEVCSLSVLCDLRPGARLTKHATRAGLVRRTVPAPRPAGSRAHSRH